MIWFSRSNTNLENYLSLFVVQLSWNLLPIATNCSKSVRFAFSRDCFKSTLFFPIIPLNIDPSLLSTDASHKIRIFTKRYVKYCMDALGACKFNCKYFGLYAT